MKAILFYKRFKAYLINTSWIMGQKFFALGVGFFVTVLVARYLGPEKYGILSYAVSMTALFAVAGHMGLDGLVVREIVKKPGERAETLGTSLALKLLGVVVGYAFLFVYMMIYEDPGSPEFWVLIVVASSLFFMPFMVVDSWFQAHVQAKYTAVAMSASLFLAAIFKVLLVYLNAGLLLFAFANFLQTFLAACFLLLIFRATANLPFATWRVNFSKAKELLSQGWVIFLGTLFATIYLKIDQVMLKWLVGPKDVGIYAVAATFSEAWYFVPAAIVTSLFPQLIKLRETDSASFNMRLQQIFDLLFTTALVVALFVSLLAGPVINLFFGNKYLASSSILAIHIWVALFVFMRAAFSKWILIENVLVFSLITQGLGALANVGFNLVLIPRYAGYGAAVSTLISYAIASYFSLFIYSKTRPIFWMMSKAMFAPVRYPWSCFRGKEHEC